MSIGPGQEETTMANSLSTKSSLPVGDHPLPEDASITFQLCRRITWTGGAPCPTSAGSHRS